MSGANYREADFPGVRAAGRHNNSITTKELTECDREPVHLIANVQGGTGHLLFIHYPSGKILAHDRDIEHIPWIRCHENRTVTAGRTGARTTSSFHGEQQSGESPHEAIGISGGFLLNWVPHDFYEKILDLVLGIIHSDTHRNFYFYSYDGSAYAISISATEMDYSVIGIEIETVGLDDTASHFSSSLLHLGRIVEFYQHEAIAKTACDTVFHLLGKYDRGMVYRFHDDLSGEVVHEIKANHVESSYLGMRFPSSDIPLPSRQLYIKNGVRYIYDVDTEDLPILSLDNEKMDLSQIRMRAVAKPHIVYLRNMGVVSSLSLAIVVDNDLWGLLAFHGYGARYKPSLHQRIACETISAMVSVRIESLMKKAQSARIIKLGQCTMSLKHDQSLIHNLYEWGEGILEIVDGDVLVAHVQDPRDGEGDRIVLGDPLLVPKDSFWTKMSSYQNRELCVISTRKALTDIKLTQEECPASGIVFFQEGRTQIMIGRAMRSKDVVWAGNPDEPKLRIGGILNPRNSFTQFIEKARKESRAWTVQDISVISVLRDRICEHSYAYMMGLLRGDIQDANRKYLAAIDRARDNYEFFAHMSHELRTPFHGVMGCLSILHESIEDMPAAEVRDVVDTAIASGNHMINLLNDILDISKNKHLSHISAQDKVIYQTLAFETIDCMKSLATSRKIEMRSSIEPKGLEKVVIVTDRTKIIQIVSNVVNNAIKFTGEGTVDVVFRLVDSLQEATMMWERGAEVHAGSVFSMKESEMHTSAEEVRRSTMTFNETHDQKWMTMSVSDTGCGMEPCELVEMFSPYTQSSHGSNRIFQGTGLGLFICVSLCYQLNGFISCASTPDKGTLFHMGIPVGLLAEDTVEGNQTLTDDTKETESVIQMSGPILIVDDNVVNVKILNRALLLDIRRAGLAIEVLTAGGGAEGVQVFRDKRPSLCIIDYHMPDVDGIEATCTIRKYEQENKIDPTYILMYTADATEQAKALILSSGVDDIMSKPPPKGFIAGLVQRLRVPE